MLLVLPKDILIYILSIVVHDSYVKRYMLANNGDNLKRHVQTLTSTSFLCEHRHSHLSSFVKDLRLIHPSIRRLFAQMTIFNGSGWWAFKPCFFEVLSPK